jgi:hypothetical protein
MREQPPGGFPARMVVGAAYSLNFLSVCSQRL